MKITTSQNGTALTVALEGRLDTTTSPELEAKLSESLSGITDLTIDLGSLEYISSAGLRVLLATHKKMMAKGKMTVVNVNDTVSEIFSITGFSGILNIE